MKNRITTDEAVKMLTQNLTGLQWRSCKGYGAPDGTYSWYYAEDRIYILRHNKLKSYHFINANSPYMAWERLKATFVSK